MRRLASCAGHCSALVSALVVSASLTITAGVASQGRWQPAPSLPVAVSDHAMAFDGVSDGILLFGGYEVTALSTTRTWDGTRWVLRSPARRPPARLGHAMVYDSLRNRVVLFGGWDQTTYLDDTWAWDGNTWAPLQPATRPPARAYHAMAYDVHRDRVVMVAVGQTWEFDGTDWVRRQPANSPSGLLQSSMAYDAARRRCVLLEWCGRRQWEWDGNDWTERTPATRPGTWSALVYHEARQRVMSIGGRCTNQASTWEWDGNNWSIVTPPGALPASIKSPAAYDPVRRQVVRAGGEVWCGIHSCTTADTFVFSNPRPAVYIPFGTGCPGTGSTPWLGRANGSLPWLGDTFELMVAGLPTSVPVVPVGILGASNTQWGAIPLPFGLGVLGAPGCTLYASVEVVFTLTSAEGTAHWPIPIPENPALVGAILYSQGLVFGDPINPAGIVATVAGDISIGVR